MARPPKYTDDDLLIAVQEYAKEHQGKISYKGLALWASEHIPALYDVKDTDFRRNHRIGNGDKESNEKACRKLIVEINKSRCISDPVAKAYDSLMYCTDTKVFLSLPESDQIRAILMCRNKIDELLKRNIALSKKCSKLSAENKSIREVYDKICRQQDDIMKALEKYRKISSIIADTIDEERRREVFSDIGIENGVLDPAKVLESMSIDPDKAFSFDCPLASRIPDLQRLDTQIAAAKDLYTNIIDGIKFGEKK